MKKRHLIPKIHVEKVDEKYPEKPHLRFDDNRIYLGNKPFALEKANDCYLSESSDEDNDYLVRIKPYYGFDDNHKWVIVNQSIIIYKLQEIVNIEREMGK